MRLMFRSAITLVLCLSSPLLANTITVHGAPYQLSGRVNLDFEGTWFDSCVPEFPLIMFRDGRIEFRLYPYQAPGFDPLASCDFVFRPFAFNVDELFIPVDSGISEGLVDFDLYYLFPGFSEILDRQSVDVILNDDQEQYIFLAQSDNFLKVLRRSDFSVVTQSEFPDLIGIQTDDGHTFFPEYVFQADAFFGEFSTVRMEFNTGVIRAPSLGSAGGVWVGFSYDLDNRDSNDMPSDIIRTVFRPNSSEPFRLAGGYDTVNRSIFLDDLTTEIVAIVEADIAIASMPDNNQLMVVNLFDLTDQSFVASGATPDILHANLNGERLLLYEKGDQMLAVMDISTRTFTYRFPVTDEILGITSDPILPYFYVWDSANRLIVYDADLGQIVAQVSFDGTLVGLSMNPIGGEILAFSNFANSYRIDVLSTADFSVVDSRSLTGNLVGVPKYLSVPYWAAAVAGTPLPVPTNSAWFLLVLFFGLAVLALRSRVLRKLATHPGVRKF